jgi:hypothetical protein
MLDDRARASDYDDPMSSRMLGIAADVLRSFGSAFGGRHLAIVGGAAPGLLVPSVPPGLAPHVGTADLDFHLSLHLLDGETADYYQAIIDGCAHSGCAPISRAGGRSNGAGSADTVMSGFESSPGRAARSRPSRSDSDTSFPTTLSCSSAASKPTVGC